MTPDGGDDVHQQLVDTVIESCRHFAVVTPAATKLATRCTPTARPQHVNFTPSPIRDTFPEGSIPIFGGTRIFLKHSVGQ